MYDYREFLKYGIGEIIKENLLGRIEYISELLDKLSVQFDELNISDEQYKELDHLLTKVDVQIESLKDEIKY